MKNQLNTLILLLLMSSVTIACAQWDGTSERASGPVTKKQLDLDGFSGIGLTLSADVHIRQGNRQEVEIEARESVIENITTNVRNDFWKIGFERNMRNYDKITIWITVPELDRLSVSGSGDIKGKGKFEDLEELDLVISGSGNINLEFEAEKTSCTLTGSGDMTVVGTTKTQKISVTGSGDVSSFDLDTRDCVVRITGSGDCEVSASDNLEVYLTGSGDVDYKGDPNVRSRILGSGDIRNRGK
ncbi:MAG: head GIN domain-containing protein [Bacteroidota bacterium]